MCWDFYYGMHEMQGFTKITLPAGFDLPNVKVVVKGAYSVLSAWKNAGEMACSVINGRKLGIFMTLR